MRASVWVAKAAVSALILLTLGGGTPAQSTDDANAPAAAPAAGAMQLGDVAVTGFSGTMLAADKLAPGVDPIDRTFINPNGPALRVFDASDLKGAPAGTLVEAPLRLDVPASQIGQVFALTFDDGKVGAPPNLYAAATSAFGLNIVGAGQAADGKPVRLKAGAPDAVFMDGQFGSLGSNSPSAIYKIDGATGAPSYFADTAFAGLSNSGPGIGGVAFDAESRSLYASDLDTGLIHRFGLDYNAADLSQFDHGVAGRRAKGLEPIADDGIHLQIVDPTFKPDDPATWGITQPERRVDAIAVHDGRLYYAVADGPEVWSVGLKGGDFADDARLELKVKAQKPYPVTSIAFDGNGRMLLAQRGPSLSPYDYGSYTAGGGEVLRYAPTTAKDTQPEERWQPEPASYAVGTADDGRASDGGVSLQYAYKPDGTLDTGVCDASVVMSGDALTPKTNGVQINGIDLVRPANVPPTQSAFIDYDQRDDDPAVRGHIGGVATLRNCGADSVFPPVQEGGAEGMPPVEGGAEGMPPTEGGGGGAMPPTEGGGGATTPPTEDTPAEPEFPETEPEGGGGETAEVGGVSITKSPGSGKCTEKGGCSFNIDITNNSGKDLPEIVVGDELTAGAANLGGAKIEGAPPAPWTCTAPPKFTCKHPGPIADGELVSLPLSFAPTGIGQEKELKNCATLQAQAGAPEPAQAFAPQNLAGPEDATLNDVKFQVRPVGDSCDPKTGCEWELTATNTGAAEVSGPLDLTIRASHEGPGAAGSENARTVSLESKDSSTPIECKQDNGQVGATNIKCNKNPLTLAPGEKFTLRYKLSSKGTADKAIGSVSALVSVHFKDGDKEVTAANKAAVPPAAGGGDGAGAGPADAQNAGAPSEPVCATLPVETTDANPDEKQAGPLVLQKVPAVTSCSALGGGCEFKITITNPGPGDFEGPVEFDDATTLLDQKADMALTAQFPPDWKCNFDKQGSGHCSHAGPLKAGAPPLEITIPLMPLQTTAAGAIRNCATLAGTTQPICAEIPLRKDKTPLLRPKKTLVSGDCRPECEFLITVTNVGEGTSTEPFSFTDEALKSTGIKLAPFASLGAEFTVTDQSNGVTCIPSLGPPICRFSGPVQPGGSVGIHVKMVVTDKQFSGLNCAKVGPQESVDNSQVRQRCLEIKRDGKGEAPVPNLTIEKRGVGPDAGGGDFHCDLKKECLYIITVRNTGNSDFVGPIKITDTVTLGVPEVIEAGPGGNIGWDCTTARNGKGGIAVSTSIECTIPGAPDPLNPGNFLPLGPGKQIELGLSVKPGSTWQDSQFLNNCASVVPATEGKDIGPLQGDKSRCARAKLDPFNVQVIKTGDQNCQPGGECRFDIDIFDPGPIPHHAPVTVTDKLSGLSSAEIVSITPGAGADRFPCDPAPTKIPFTCTGDMELEIGEHNHYTMIVRLPADATAASFSNCATVGGARSSGATSDPSCHSVQLPTPEQPFSLKIKKTGPATCAPGSECAFDLTLSNAGSKDYVGAVTLTDGLSGTDSMSIVSVEPPLPCKAQPTDIPFNCKTADDFSLPAGGSRTFRVTARVPRSADTFTNCAIIADGKASRSGERGPDAPSSCVTVKAPEKHRDTTEPSCKGGMILLPENECACPPGTTWRGRSCTQGDGGASGVTMPTSTDECPADRPNGVFPHCCPSHTRFVDGVCRRIEGPPPQCPRSRPIGSYPHCCERGTHYDNGVCNRDVKETPEECPRSRPIGSYPHCCERGTHYDDGVCKRDVKETPEECPRSRPIGSYPHCCERGTHYDNGVCNRDVKETPEECPRSRPIGSYPHCCERGTHYDNGVCNRDVKETPEECPRSRPIGSYPHCCERGTHYDDGVCKRDVKETPEECPRSRPIGSYPHCCERGTHYDNGVCKRDVKETPEECPRSRPIGSYPHCCERGTHYDNGVCKRDGGAPTPSKTDPSKAKCTGGRRGTPPNCFCLPPSRFIGGRCRHIPKPATPKKDDGPVVR